MEDYIKKNLDMAVLIDFYSELLTEKQKECVTCYFNEDLTLSEIAINNGISRQGVYDTIKSAQVRLTELEKKIGIVKKVDKIKKLLQFLSQEIFYIEKENQSLVKSKCIEEHVLNINSAIDDFVQKEC